MAIITQSFQIITPLTLWSFASTTQKASVGCLLWVNLFNSVPVGAKTAHFLSLPDNISCGLCALTIPVLFNTYHFRFCSLHYENHGISSRRSLGTFLSVCHFVFTELRRYSYIVYDYSLKMHKHMHSSKCMYLLQLELFPHSQEICIQKNRW